MNCGTYQGKGIMPTATHPLDPIRELAAQWVARQFAGGLSEQELAEFDAWRKANQRHEDCVRMCIASRWAEQMRDGNIGTSAREAFTRWLDEDPRNMEEFRLATQLFIAGLGRS